MSDNIYLSCQNQIYGPVDVNTVYKWIQEGSLKFNDWIWLPDVQDWYPLIEVPQLTTYFYSYENKPTFKPENNQPAKPEPEGTKIYVSSEKVDFAGEEVEKRRFKRHSVLIPVFYKKHLDFSEEKEKEIEGVTEDLSMSGIGFFSKIRFNVGDMLDIKLDIFPDIFETLAQVMRIKESDNKYFIGAKFVRTSQAYLDKLKKFLEYL
jgi:hypothetical protein